MKAKDNNFLRDCLSLLLIPVFLMTAISVKSFFKSRHPELPGILAKNLYYNKNTFFDERPMDINMASVQELAGLPGIGQKTAQAITGFREGNGIIWDMSDLLRPFGPLNYREYQVISCYCDVNLGH